MIKICVTGSISSGKSSTVRLFSNNRYPIFDADREVKKIYREKSFLFKARKFLPNLDIKSSFKSQIKQKILGKTDNLKQLEKIIHPLVRKKMKLFTKKHKNKKRLIFEIPLLIESKLMRYFDVIILVTCQRKKRLKRYLNNGGSRKLFNFLNQRQLSERKKRKFCQHVIKNDKSYDVLKKNVLNIIKNYE